MVNAAKPRDAAEIAKQTYDVVIVGGGIVGAIMAKTLANDGKKVLLLEAGRATSIRPEGYASYVENFYTTVAKLPNAPYPENPNVPAISLLELRKLAKTHDGKRYIPSAVGYPVFLGPLPFYSNYTRTLGGTTLHFLGTCIRMLPPDFELASRYKVANDWPISYSDMMPYYEQAELEVGVSADPAEQEREWPTRRPDDPPLFPRNFQFPMQQIPPTYLDRWLNWHLRGTTISSLKLTPPYPRADGKLPVHVVGTPAGRNGMPNPKYIDRRTRKPYHPNGAPYNTRMGQRCEGNSACVPICPVMAKYNALRSLYSVDPKKAKHLTIVTQAVASTIEFDKNRKRVTGITCKMYDDESVARFQSVTFKGRVYVIAAHAIETAKLLLASRTDRAPKGAANSSGLVGRNLMDHPYFVTHGLAPAGAQLGVYRGPQITSEIPMRDGEFRTEFAAFRGDIRNGGWDFATGAPYTTVEGLVRPGGKTKRKGLFGTKLRKRLRSEAQRHISFGYQVEQLPNKRNRVDIKEEYKDQLGNYRPVITYDIDAYTRKGIRAALDLTVAVLHHAGGEDLTVKDLSKDDENNPGYIEIPPTTTKGRPSHVIINGSGHIMGTHRMGDHTKDSVVDKHQRTHDHDNLYLVGCGNMVTVGTSNPTLTAAALAFKAVERIKRDL